MRNNVPEEHGKQMYELVKSLHFSRPAGTEAEKQAALYLNNKFISMGLAPQIETFSFEDIEITEQSFEVLSPYKQNIPCAAYGYLNGVNFMEADGELLYIENADEISLKKAAGKIVLVNGIVNDSLYKKLQQYNVLGFISIVGTPADKANDAMPTSKILKKPSGKQLPGVCIHWKDAVKLVEISLPLKIHLKITQRPTTCNSCNVLAKIIGNKFPEEIITVTAHYDSVPQGPGAYDNLSAVAILMETCRFFTQHPPKRTIEFICFGAEEKGLKGSIAYVQKHSSELANHQFMLNMDLAGQTIGGTVIGLTAKKDVENTLKTMLQDIGIGCTFKRQIWSSDSNTFAWKGIPSLTINRDGYGMHTHHDTIEYISEWSLKNSFSLLRHLCLYLSNIETLPFKREVPKEFLEKLSLYFD